MAEAELFELDVWISAAVEIVKASRLLSIFGIGELLLKTQEVIGRGLLILTFFTFAGLLYFLVNFSIERFGRIWCERALPPHDRLRLKVGP
jgi:polar amino acid transport system permease protein